MKGLSCWPIRNHSSSGSLDQSTEQGALESMVGPLFLLTDDDMQKERVRVSVKEAEVMVGPLSKNIILLYCNSRVNKFVFLKFSHQIIWNFAPEPEHCSGRELS